MSWALHLGALSREADVLDPCRYQDLLVGVPEGVRVVHRTRLG